MYLISSSPTHHYLTSLPSPQIQHQLESAFLLLLLLLLRLRLLLNPLLGLYLFAAVPRDQPRTRLSQSIALIPTYICANCDSHLIVWARSFVLIVV